MPAPFIGFKQYFVRHDVEFLLDFALDVFAFKTAKDAAQSPFANGAAIFTQNGYYAREFAKRVDAGMVGVNVPIPVPYGVFPFSGHKDSFFGDLHCLGKDGVRFYTESKCVTSRWFDEEEAKREKVDSWDGTI